MSSARPRFSPDTAFVVQLGAETSIGEGRISGRVEHMTSGTSEPFATLEELLEFMNRHGASRLSGASTAAS